MIWVVLLFGLSGSMPLVSREFVEGNICPRILGTPACYIIFGCLLLALISHANFLKDKNKLYFTGVLVALSIATVGSIGNLLGYIECPKTDNGTPMCYLSFMLFFGLLLGKLLLLRRTVK